MPYGAVPGAGVPGYGVPGYGVPGLRGPGCRGAALRGAGGSRKSLFVEKLLILCSAVVGAPRRGPLELLIMQPTTFCNIDCGYCYLPARSVRRVMTQETVARLFEEVLSGPFCAERLTVVWHAGEPLIPGIDFYEQAFATIRRLNRGRVDVTQSFQTNGTLLTQAWVDFFHRHDVSLGISIDGPKWLHDMNRRTRKGAGSFGKTMAAVRLLQENRFPFHVIAVLTSASLSAADEIFRFFVDNRIVDVGFNIEECEGANVSSSLGDTPYEDVRCFFERIAFLCADSGDTLLISGLRSKSLHLVSRFVRPVQEQSCVL